MTDALPSDIETVSRAAWDAAVAAARGRPSQAVVASHGAIAAASALGAVLLAANAKSQRRRPSTLEVQMLVTAFQDGILHNLAAEHGLEVAPPAG